MAINYFIGKTEAWLETELSKAQADKAAGKTVTESGAGDVSTTETLLGNINERIEHLLYALYLLNPTDYPRASARRVTRTKAQFYG